MEPTQTEFWEMLCERFQQERPELFRSWIRELRAGELRGGRLCVIVDDSARLHYLRDRCGETFTAIAVDLTGRLVTVAFECPAQQARSPRPFSRLGQADPPLDADYTFDEFVVGPANRLAHAACQAVATQPGASYNPLFIHGPSGLGKSHLLQATCAELAARRPDTVAVYVSCESFVNEFIRAIADGYVQEFRDAYRAVDVLAIDDVQFLAKRETSQEEFFHTFNALYQSRRQILLSADVPPSEIPTLEDRLVSRFNWGLVAHTAPPDQETRCAILQRKAQLRGYDVPHDLLDMIAEAIDSNVRMLEGALTRLVTQARLTGAALTRELVTATLEELGAQPKRQLQISDILDLVSSYYGIRRAELLGKKRTRSIVQPRHVGMYLARKMTPLSLEEIGGHFGGRDHSTVLHAERSVEELLKTQDQQTEQALAVLTRRLMAKR
ncbi:MAG: chromosomal replication initiator protein DnaA [Planctomycetes bacterium]|nr:chromosomal replication initiator protein DnaA [Planctomycetota bacterium]